MFPFIISFSLGTFSVFFPFSCFFLLFPHSLTPALVVSACLCSHGAVLPVFIIFLRVFSSEAPLLLKPLTCIFQAGGGGSTSWNSSQKLLLRNPYKQLLVPCWEGKFASSWRNLLSSYSTLKKKSQYRITESGQQMPEPRGFHFQPCCRCVCRPSSASGSASGGLTTLRQMREWKLNTGGIWGQVFHKGPESNKLLPGASVFLEKECRQGHSLSQQI